VAAAACHLSRSIPPQDMLQTQSVTASLSRVALHLTKPTHRYLGGFL
jgi:hypothetical protein